jgi:dCTP deaminase
MVLSDKDIKEAIKKGHIKMDPFEDKMIQPSSIDFRISNKFRVFRNYKYTFIDPRQKQEGLTDLIEIEEGSPFILHPGEFILSSSQEYLELDNTIVCRVEGKSSLGRLGLIIHATAGFVDPGWAGTITLELSNVSNLPIALYSGMKIGQFSFMYLKSPCEKPYGSAGLNNKYRGQVDPEPSQMYKNFKQGTLL